MKQPKGITVQIGNGPTITLKEYRNRELLRNVPLGMLLGALGGKLYSEWDKTPWTPKRSIYGAVIGGLFSMGLVLNKINKIGK